MIKALTSLTKSATVRASGVNILGSALSAGLGFAAMALIARNLGQQNFGVFSLATAVMTFVVSLSDFGLGTALSRFVGKNHTDNPEEARKFARIVFEVELAIGLIILISAWVLPSTISVFIRGDESLTAPFRLAILAAFGLSFNAYILALLQAYQKFTRLAVWQGMTGIIKFSAVGLLIVSGALSVENGLWIYALVPVLGFFIGVWLWPTKIWEADLLGSRQRYLGQVFSFTKWLFLSYIINTIGGRVDVFFLSKFKDLETVGTYSAAYQLALAMPLFIGALTAVLLPKVSGFTSKSQYLGYLRRALPILLVLVVVLLPVLLLSQFVVPLIFSAKYVAAVPMFNILFVGYLLALVANPIGIILYSLNRPQVLTLINLISLGVVLIGNFLLVPLFGGEGAALAFVASNLVGMVLGLFFVFRAVRRV